MNMTTCRVELRIVELSLLEAREALTWSEYVRMMRNALAWHSLSKHLYP